MTNNEIRAAIAGACGWKRGQLGSCYIYYTTDPKDFRGAIPNYPNDLNAMHEAEETLTYEQQQAYLDNFHWARIHSNPTLAKWGLVHATARQRAEAFLKTIGKWIENPIAGEDI